MQRLEQLGWLAEGDENDEYTLTDAGRLAVRRALGDVVAFVQFEADRAGRTYIAGPMTGHDDFNYPAFNAAAAQLRSLGIAAINPADHGVVPGAKWEDYLRSDIAQLATCESIHFLLDWSKSRDALLEHHIATWLGMQLLFAQGAEKPEAVRLRDKLQERTPIDYAIEHAGYLVTAANHLLEARNELDAVILRREQGEDVGDDEIQAAEGGVGDANGGLRIAIYEFEKRRARARAFVQPPRLGRGMRRESTTKTCWTKPRT